MALTQAQRVRDSRGAPEFIFNPRLGETYQEALDLKGNPSMEKDWYETKFKATNETYRYTVAHWCATEARFRNHLKKIKPDDAAKMIPLENMLVRVTQQVVVYRRYLVPSHRSYIPDFGVYIKVQGPKGDVEYRSLSRQLVMFCVERRKAWRMLQSKAGIENKEYKAQRSILADLEAGKISKDEFFAHAEELMKERLGSSAGEAPKPESPLQAVAAVAAKAAAGVSVKVIRPRESEAPLPASPAPAVAPAAPATVSETSGNVHESEAPQVVVAMSTQVTVERVQEVENEPAWEQGVQIRLMELDVDPGNDADRGFSKGRGA
jgi:hypothetical protein